MRARNVIATVVCLLLTSAMYAQKRNITEKDIFSFTWIGDTQLSPDGSHAAYVQTTAIYLLDTAQPMTPARRLTNGPHDAQPRWSPDGMQIAFTRALEKEGKPQPAQLYVLSLAGGEPVQVSSMEKGVGSPQWAPNGSCIAVVSETPIVPEPKGGAHADPAQAARLLGEALRETIDDLGDIPGDELRRRRRAKFRSLGVFA